MTNEEIISRAQSILYDSERAGTFSHEDIGILSAAIGIGRISIRSRQAQTPCSRCGYGGKHLDAPPCTTCPAHPKGRESNAPLTLDELRQMDGEPVYISFLSESERDGYWDVKAFTNSEFFRGYRSGTLLLTEYETSWLAYRRKPEEDHHDSD